MLENSRFTYVIFTAALAAFFFGGLGRGASAQNLAAQIAQEWPNLSNMTTSAYENQRMGWYPYETTLTPALLTGSSGFGVQATVNLGTSINGQPLAVAQSFFPGGVGPVGSGPNGVIYLQTITNKIYALDAGTGAILLQRDLGTPPPATCGAKKQGLAINAAGPVIDPVSKTLYAVARSSVAGVSTYKLYALNLVTLANKVKAEVVSGTQTLTDGSTTTFVADQWKPHASLLFSSGNVYVAFHQACEEGSVPMLSRGWLMGWNGRTLVPMTTSTGSPLEMLTNSDATAPDNWFQTSIWMSGAGLAADEQGNVFFVTGNSDPSGTTYNSLTNISETAAKLDPLTGQIVTFFTPWNVAKLDEKDSDFGAGGITLFPSFASAVPLATAGGKDGNLYLLNQDSMGGFTPNGPNNVLAQVKQGKCWCAESAFITNTTPLTPWVVSSGGNTIELWQVTNPQSTSPSLQLVASSPALPSQIAEPRMFTTVSSNIDQNPIIWTVAGLYPSTTTPVTLYAFSATPVPGSTTLQQLYSAPVGPWTTHYFYSKPMVWNGRVYAWSSSQLLIFGLPPAASARR